MTANKRNFATDTTTGFGTHHVNRLYRRDGQANVLRRGIPFFDRFSWFHTWVSMPNWLFFFYLFLFYIIINSVFAVIYFFIGVEHLGGVHSQSRVQDFWQAFFFSAQTFTTVGYGHIAPSGFLTNMVAVFEAFLGLLSFALVSGLFYSRFARPRSFLYFSHAALIAPYNGGKALMFRTAPHKNNHLTEAEVKLTLAVQTIENGEEKNFFYTLETELNSLNALVLNWTIVHPITESSPLFEASLDDLRKMKAELLVFIKAYDEAYASTVIGRTSYTADEIIEDACFKPMYRTSSSGKHIILEVNKLNDIEKII